MKKRIVATLLLLAAGQVFSQTISVMPQNVSNMGAVQVGNAVSNKCNGLSPNYVKLTIQPSCYGANLRSGGVTLNPEEGDVELDLTINNGGSSYNSKVRFPNKVTWPENYGQTCRWNGAEPLSTVYCDQESSVVSYNCSYVKAPWFLDDYLKCTRIGDPLNHQALNEDIHCGLLYTWQGTNYAAVNSYKQITSVANCGLRERNEDWANLMTVSSSVPASNISKYAKRGKVVVAYSGLSIKKLSVVKDNTTGNFITSGSKSQVTANFSQFTTSGVRKSLSQKVETTFDEFEECLDIKATFLGTNQFCGSFYSPIMMFFDEKLPQFAGTSSFPLVPGVKMIYWPEAKAPGYFLALDEFNSGKITSNKQLFGESADYKNGFESLKRFDLNHDEIIDASDAVFAKLVLWQDADGNGISSSEELATLASKGITSISLKYNDDHRKNFGKRAEARQAAEFNFSRDGKTLKGSAVDIWFAPNSMANKPQKKK